MMKTFLLSLAIVGIISSVATAQVPVASQLTVTHKWGNGKQYFHVTFTKPSAALADSNNSYSYILERWCGALPDTTNIAKVTTISEGNGSTAAYDDYDVAPPNQRSDSGTSLIYSYSVITNVQNYFDTTSGGTFSSPIALVTGTMDTTQIIFTKSLSSYNTLPPGDTLRGTFKAVSSPGAVMRYSLLPSYDSTSAGAIDSISGNFWGKMTGMQPAEFTVQATDDAGRQARTSFGIYPLISSDTLTLTLMDAKRNPIPTGTICYYALLPANVTDTMGQDTRMAVPVEAGGVVYVVCDSGLYTLRVSAEGYGAAVVNDSRKLKFIGTSGTYPVVLVNVASYTFSGSVTNENNLPVPQAMIEFTRNYGWADHPYSSLLDTVRTDNKGAFSLSVPIGDSILGTSAIQIEASMQGYGDSPQYYNPTGNSTSIVVSSNVANIKFSFKQNITNIGLVNVSVTLVPRPSVYNNLLQVTAYSLTDSGVAVTADSVQWRYELTSMSLPYGKYIFFAQPIVQNPNDTGAKYLAGYYSRTGYVATWQQADTVTVNTRYAQDSLAITLVQDSSVTPPGGGAPIDGIVSDSSGNVLANAQMLLYKQVSAPAGATATIRLVQTTMTDFAGSYSFGNVAVGTYSISVDPVGGSLLSLGNVKVDSAGKAVEKNITYSNTTDVPEHTDVLPNAPMLAQNYPNPFSSTTNIAFTIDAPQSSVDLSVYDITGRRVATMLQQHLAKGSYVVSFTQQLLPGVYTCVLRNGNSLERRMMTVVR